MRVGGVGCISVLCIKMNKHPHPKCVWQTISWKAFSDNVNFTLVFCIFIFLKTYIPAIAARDIFEINYNKREFTTKTAMAYVTDEERVAIALGIHDSDGPHGKISKQFTSNLESHETTLDEILKFDKESLRNILNF